MLRYENVRIFKRTAFIPAGAVMAGVQGASRTLYPRWLIAAFYFEKQPA